MSEQSILPTIPANGPIFRADVEALNEPSEYDRLCIQLNVAVRNRMFDGQPVAAAPTRGQVNYLAYMLQVLDTTSTEAKRLKQELEATQLRLAEAEARIERYEDAMNGVKEMINGLADSHDQTARSTCFRAIGIVIRQATTAKS